MNSSTNSSTNSSMNNSSTNSSINSLAGSNMRNNTVPIQLDGSKLPVDDIDVTKVDVLQKREAGNVPIARVDLMLAQLFDDGTKLRKQLALLLRSPILGAWKQKAMAVRALKAQVAPIVATYTSPLVDRELIIDLIDLEVGKRGKWNQDGWGHSKCYDSVRLIMRGFG
ncbi:hypothetical protein BGX38DRAFT_1277166 [Terfezia claveryi]|nr:hypothetical protein BGX38DRAFT_1277166 [Terfezia claveryi]